MRIVEAYTDGACSGNPGPGGWAAILFFKGSEKEISGGEPHTTNNRMEIRAAIEGLNALKRPCAVDLFTDIGGDYVGDGAGFRIGLIHGQRVHALTGLGDEERIGCNENRGDGTAGYEDQLGRKRLHFEIEHLGPNGNRQPEGADVNG